MRSDGELQVGKVFLIAQWFADNARYEYVRSFEQPDNLLPNTWIVVRIDGRGFHKSVPVPVREADWLETKHR